MDIESISNSPNSDILAKMKRLKIQENILLQNLNKSFYKVNQVENANANFENLRNTSEFKRKSIKINNLYIDIKNLFDEIKAIIYSKEILKSLEIADIKKKILELETNIKSFKADLATELASLKLSEQTLTKQINENLNVIDKLKKRPKLRTISFHKIVPSPVKVMMNSPLKCLEVQEFYEFMSNSQNRFGSWNEYNHNIFVKYWQKYFQTDNLLDSDQSSEVFQLFLQELLDELHDVKKEDISTHVTWYLKYIHLKERKQKALDSWKSNKRRIAQVKKIMNDEKTHSVNVELTGDVKNTKLPHQDQILCNLIQTSLEDLLPDDKKISNQNHPKQKSSFNFFYNTKQSDSTGAVKYIPRFSKATKQWINRCDGNSPSEDKLNCIDKIKKLSIPSWRLGLYDYT